MAEAGRQVRLLRYDDADTAVSEAIVLPYARYSTDNQSSTSTEDQLRLIRRAVELGHIKSQLFPNARLRLGPEFKDEAVSGFGMVGRDGLDAALSAIRQKRAHIIAVACQKRFFRGMGTALFLYDFLTEHGAELLAVSDGFSSAEKSARLKFMNKAYASEEFLESVSIDTKRGLDERRYDGFSDGHLWFGVGSRPTRETVCKGKLKPSHYDYYIIESQADLVRRIFALARDGYSHLQIARLLTSEHIPPPMHYDKEGNVRIDPKRSRDWRPRTVNHILGTKAYVGLIERGKTKIIKRTDGSKQTLSVPMSQWIVIERPDLRIVPQDLWNAVRQRYKEYNVRRLELCPDGQPFQNDGRPRHVLTGLFSCGDCGGEIVVVSGRRGGYYGCQRSHRMHACSNRKVINWKRFELPFLQWVIGKVCSDEVCAAIADRYNEYRRSRTNVECADLVNKGARLDEVTVAVDNIVNAIEQGVASDVLLGRLRDLECEKATLLERIKYLEGIDQSAVYMTPAAIKKRFADVPRLLQQSEPFEVYRSLKPLLAGSSVKLERRPSADERGTYWAVGALNLGRAVTLADGSGGLGSAGITLNVPLELRLD